MNYKKIKLSNLKDLGKGNTDSLVVITTPFVQHLLIPALLILSFTWLIVSGQSSFYILPLLIVSILLMHKFWVLFESINIIRINKSDKLFVLISRNLIKRLFVRNKTIYFNNIQKFVLTEGPEIIHEPTRFIISAELKDSSNIFFSSTSKKILANEMMEFLNQVVTPSKQI